MSPRLWTGEQPTGLLRIAEAAALLGTDPKTLGARIRKLGIEPAKVLGRIEVIDDAGNVRPFTRRTYRPADLERAAGRELPGVELTDEGRRWEAALIEDELANLNAEPDEQ
jgi:hypothetical protein